MKLTNKIGLFALLVGQLAMIQPALAQDGAALYAAKACLACHGPDGNTPNIDTTPKIAGQNKGYLVQQLKDIKSGARSNGGTAQMTALMAGITDDEIDAIATYLSSL